MAMDGTLQWVKQFQHKAGARRKRNVRVAGFHGTEYNLGVDVIPHVDPVTVTDINWPVADHGGPGGIDAVMDKA
jgi:hypothetical protein